MGGPYLVNAQVAIAAVITSTPLSRTLLSLTTGGPVQATGWVQAQPRMDVENVARTVVYMATLPLDANVQFMTVKCPISAAGNVQRGYVFFTASQKDITAYFPT